MVKNENISEEKSSRDDVDVDDKTLSTYPIDREQSGHDLCHRKKILLKLEILIITLSSNASPGTDLTGRYNLLSTAFKKHLSSISLTSIILSRDD